MILDEFNEFVWPGFDLRNVPGKPSRYDYGFLPPALFAKIITRVLELHRAGKADVSSVRLALARGAAVRAGAKVDLMPAILACDLVVELVHLSAGLFDFELGDAFEEDPS
jgi:hypothetical protein